MEHRYDIRLPVVLDAFIYNQARCWHTKTHDISLGGISMETQPGIFLLHRDVEVELRLPTQQGEKHYRLPAWVVHRTPYNLGLMFRSLNVEQAQTLRTLLRELPMSPKTFTVTG